jgi:hypothetical protein
MKEKPKNNFVDTTRYKTKDPYKVALLRCMGAKVIERVADDPKNIVFTLEHEDILKLVNDIHSGQLHDLSKFIEYHKQEMGFIRDIRQNRGGG